MIDNHAWWPSLTVGEGIEVDALAEAANDHAHPLFATISSIDRFREMMLAENADPQYVHESYAFWRIRWESGVRVLCSPHIAEWLIDACEESFEAVRHQLAWLARNAERS